MKKNWWMGFLGLFSIYGGVGLINGEWISAVWFLWLVWFAYFFPEKKTEEKVDSGQALERSTNEKLGKNNKNGNGKLKGIVS